MRLSFSTKVVAAIAAGVATLVVIGLIVDLRLAYIGSGLGIALLIWFISVVNRYESERRRSKSALRESETRFRSLTELSSDWYWEQDRELRLSFHSSGFAQSSGTTTNKLLGKRRWEEPDRFPLKGTWDDHRAILEAHQPFRDFEYVRIGDDGEQYFVSISGVPIHDAAGNFNGYRGIEIGRAHV